MGQPESNEFLEYQRGAFALNESITSTAPLQEMRNLHYLTNVFSSIQNVGHWGYACDETWPGTTLLIQRYEYVNLYHTVTDWWNAYFSLQNAVEPFRVIFLDAHPQGNLDKPWEQLFGHVHYARHLAGPVCMERARFVPAGYTCPFFHRDDDAGCPDVSMTKQFTQHIMKSYGVDIIKRIPGRIVIIDRVPYVAHARSNLTATKRTVSNFKTLAETLPSALRSVVHVTVQVVTLVNQTLGEQIAAIRQADVLIANHGAGLTHMLFLEDGADVFELSCSMGFFERLAKWVPAEYHCIRAPADSTISSDYWERHVVKPLKKIFAKKYGAET